MPIRSSISFGKAFSINSCNAGTNKLYPTFTIKKLTTIAAIGSNTLHFSPKKIAPDMPTRVPIEERASER